MFHSLKISKVEALTLDAIVISFDVPVELEKEFEYCPGQYLTLATTIDGEDLRRSYSICSAKGQGLRVGIKRIQDGRFSTFAQGLTVGDALQVLPPEGRFVCEPQTCAKRDFLLIAAGSGITPILSIAASLLREEPDSSVTILFGNRSTDTIMFKEELEDLKDRFLERFHIYHVLSREMQDVDFLNGRIDAKLLERMVKKKLFALPKLDGVYLCGPHQMVDDLKRFLQSADVPVHRIHSELFMTSDDDRPAIVSQEVKKAVEQGVAVEVVLDGVHRNFQLTQADHTVLEAANQAGLDLPFSCAGGMCATCRCQIVQGEAEMDKNFSLDDWEIQAGFVLACQLRPKSEKLKLDFDAA